MSWDEWNEEEAPADGQVLVSAGTQTKRVPAEASAVVEAIRSLKRELGWSNIAVEAKTEAGETIAVPGPSAVQDALDRGARVFLVFRQEKGA